MPTDIDSNGKVKLMKSNRFWFIIILLIVLGFVSFIIAGIMSLFISTDFESGNGNVALISLNGIIMNGAKPFMTDATSSDDMIRLLDKADKNPAISAIIIEINSPGGSAVASDEIAEKVKKINKTTVAVIREVGASGAYWVASSTDYIIANRMSITGSIGVISSYLDFSGFLSDHNVSYERLVAGQYKDMGTPFKELTQEERNILQKKLDKIHDYFIDEVAKNRKLSKDKVKDIATGAFYLGVEAKDLGLVDGLGSRNDAIRYLENRLNTTVTVTEYKKELTFFERLSDVMNQNSFSVGRGIGSYIFQKTNAVSNVDVWT